MAAPSRPRGDRSRSRPRAPTGVGLHKVDCNVPYTPLLEDNIGGADYFCLIGDAAVAVAQFVDPLGLNFRELSRTCRSTFDLQFQQLSKLTSIVAEWQRWSPKEYFNGRSPIGVHHVDWRLPSEFKEKYINNLKRIFAIPERDDLVLVGEGCTPERISDLLRMNREIADTQTSTDIVLIEDQESLDEWLCRHKMEHWHRKGRPTWHTGLHHHTEDYHDMSARCMYRDFSARCNLFRTACRSLLAEFKFASLVLDLHTDDETGPMISMCGFLASPRSKPWPRCCSKGTQWWNAV